MRATRIRGTSRDSAPSHLVSVGVTTRPSRPHEPAGLGGHVLHEVSVSISRRVRGQWSAPARRTFTESAELWACLDSLAAGGRRVYVVAGRASDALTLLGWWDRVRDGTVSLRFRSRTRSGKPGKVRSHPLVMQGRPDIIGYSVRGCAFRWVSVTNWADVSLADCARQCGMAPPDGYTSAGKWESAPWPAAFQAEVIHAYMGRLINWWLSNACGGWKDTPGAAAWSSYLRRCGEGQILQHSEPLALQLEHRACFGGRASTFYFGPIGNPERWDELADAPPPGPHGFGISGPIHRLDVRSMYPTILRDERFPTRLLWHSHKPDRREFMTRLKSQCVLAFARIETDRAEYPKRTREGIVYPVGTFDTVLSTPELLRAVERKELREVHEASYYTAGRPFKEWAEWVLSLRSTMKASGDAAGEAMVKLLANSLGGRLARLKMGWSDKPDQPPRVLWGDWWVTNAESGETEHWRSLCGMVQQMVRESDRPGTLAACFAHLTAYGRVRMDEVRRIAGERQVIWQDTDGVTVTDLGRGRIERTDHYHETAYGKLRLDRTIHDARYLTAKHYWADGDWTLSGIHDGYTIHGGTHAEDTTTVNPARSACDPAAQAVYRSTRLIDLTAIEPGVTVGPDGWSIPPVWFTPDSPRRRKAGQQSLWEDE